MKTLLTFLLMMLFMFGTPLLKLIFKKSEKVKTPTVKRPVQSIPHAEVEAEYSFETNDSFLRQTKEKIPKQQEYFTYETLDCESENDMKTTSSDAGYETQMSENEQKNVCDFTFDEQELYKGVIYSEILKRKYN